MLFNQNSKDPFDRTKRVDTRIPNLALRNIIEVVEHTEHIKENMLKACFHDASTQTSSDFHNEKDLEQIFKLRSFKNSFQQIMESREMLNQELNNKNSELWENINVVKNRNLELKKEVAYLRTLNRSLKFNQNKLNNDYRSTIQQLKDDSFKDILKLIKHMYDNSNSWTTSLLCIELTHNVVKKVFGPSIKYRDCAVGPDAKPKKTLFSWLNRK